MAEVNFDIPLSGVVAIVGNFGSGKTEVAVNLARKRRNDGLTVRMADLDLVNPYFRTREAKDALAALGIELILPDAMYMNADLPILTPKVAGLIRKPGDLAILDAGGDDDGATVLAALGDAFKGRDLRMLQVVNPMRPFTGTHDGCRTMKKAIEAASRLPVSGYIGNAHLMDDTDEKIVQDGHDFVRELADADRLSFVFTTAPAHILSRLDPGRLTCPVLPIERQLVPPWKKRAPLV